MDGSGSSGVPSFSAYIYNGGTCTIDSTDGTVVAGQLNLGSSTGNGALNLDAGGALAPPSGQYITEQLGTAAGSGVFTQSGGFNVATFTPHSGSGYNQILVGYTNGGYGEYDLGGGTINANAIFVGANPTSATQNGTGVFTQTGGSIGAFAAGTNKAIGVFVGGSWAGKPIGGQTGVGSYNLQNGLIVGGCETVGGDGTGTFTQSGGTNAFVGNGDYNSASMTDYNNHFGALLLGIRGTSSKGYGQGTYNLSGGLLTATVAGVTTTDGEELIGAGHGNLYPDRRNQ